MRLRPVLNVCVVIAGLVGCSSTASNATPEVGVGSSTSNRLPPPMSTPPTPTTPTPTPTTVAAPAPTEVHDYGAATAKPSVVVAGGLLTITPAGMVAPVCGQVGVLRSADGGHGVVGQITDDGSFDTGPDVTWLACLLPPTDQPVSYYVPSAVPVGRYVFCVGSRLDAKGCATVTVAARPVADTRSPLAAGRVEIAAGCPDRVVGERSPQDTAAVPINDDPARLADSFVPGIPTAALICRYAAVSLDDGSDVPLGTGGQLFSSTPIDEADAVRLADAVNRISDWEFTAGCLVGQPFAPRYSAVVFSVPGRSDVDVWIEDARGCPTLSNGFRDSGLLVNGHGSEFLKLLFILSSPAPELDTP